MQLYLYQQRHFLKYLVVNEDQKASGQVLLPSMSLKKTLLEIKSQHNIQNLDAIYICSQFSQHVIEQGLGSKPVFITTQGFESSVEIHRPLPQDTFTLKPKKPDSILNVDYVFGVDESISSTGEELEPVNQEMLEMITAKLKLSEKQNIAIGLVNSAYNNAHEQILEKHFKENGYRTFSFSHHESFKNENFRWWNSIINAYIYPPFEDFLNTLKAVFEISPEKILVLHGNNYKSFTEENSFLSSSLSHLELLKQQFKERPHILHLDTEDFFILHPQLQSQVWNTPIANTYCLHPKITKCHIQPTQYILQDPWGTLNYGYETINYEPGPMLMGKGLKLCFVDILFYKGMIQNSFLSSLSQIGSLQKIDEILLSYSKSTGLSPSELAEELIEIFCFQIKNHLMDFNVNSITVTGDLALDLLPVLNRYNKDIEFTYVEHKPLELMQQGQGL